MVRISVAAKDFGDRQVLRAIDLTLADGEVLAIVGRSGAGKTTLLRLIAGLDRAFSGGIDVEGPIGMVFQEPRLLPWRRTIENVALALPGSPRQPENLRRAADALAQVGLAGEGDTFPRALSGGMARRVALARALVVGPRLMLLDEPFASLDAATADQLRQMVAEIWRQHRVSVVLVTHDVREAMTLADRIIRLEGQPATIAADVTFGTPPTDEMSYGDERRSLDWWELPEGPLRVDGRSLI
jgi:sulfonate transport system ATP-binding protein